MALSEFDRNLLDRCLQKQAQAWEEFVDRFAGLIFYVVQTTCRSRRISVDPMVQEDLVQEVFFAILSDNFVVLRRFHGNCSLAAYLTVIARRVVVKSLLLKRGVASVSSSVAVSSAELSSVVAPERSTTSSAEEYIDNVDEILYLISRLPEREAKVVKMYHLEQKSYADIASVLGIPENTVGPILSRARNLMRKQG